MLSLAGSYSVAWSDFSDTGDRAGRFRKLVLEVSGMRGAQPAAGPEAAPTVIAVPTAGVLRSSYDTRCRQEILVAFTALERRHSRAVFSPVNPKPKPRRRKPPA